MTLTTETQTTSAAVAGLDRERQRVAKEYASIQRRLYFVELALVAIVLVVLLFSG